MPCLLAKPFRKYIALNYTYVRTRNVALYENVWHGYDTILI